MFTTNVKKVRCFLCFCEESTPNTFKNIQTNVCPGIKRTLKDVIEYLAKSANLEVELSNDFVFCYECCIKVSNFDENMRHVIKQKRDLLNSIQASMVYLDSDFEEELQAYARAEEEHFSDVMPKDNEIAETVQEVLTEQLIFSTCKKVSIVNNYVANEPIPDTEPELINENNFEKSSKMMETGDIHVSENNIDDYNEMIESDDDEDEKKSTTKTKTQVRNETTERVNQKSKGRVKCRFCDIRVSDRRELRKHREKYHQIHYCHLCNYQTCNELNLMLHRNKHEGKKETQCPLCDKMYSRKHTCLVHLETHLSVQKYQCEKCGIRFSHLVRFKRHKMHHDAEENPLFCKICKQQFKTIKTYRRHAITHREDRPRYTCEYCGKIFVDRYTRTVHLRMKHKKEYKEKADTQKSTKRQNTTKQYTCIICNESFTNKEQLDNHMENKHDVILKPVATLPELNVTQIRENPDIESVQKV